VSGTNGLSARALAIVRRLWRWREAEAARRDSPVRHVLRDDLIVSCIAGITGRCRINQKRGISCRDMKPASDRPVAQR